MTKKHQLRAVTFAASAFFIFLFYFIWSHEAVFSRDAYLGLTQTSNPRVRIAKASMLYGERNELFEHALATHDKHNKIHGYKMNVLRRQMTHGYWNKLAYLLSVVMEELQKPLDERQDWIMWVDPDVILLNPQIPLDIFAPPSEEQFEHINFLGSRTMGALSTSVFFVKPNEWTMKLLVKAMASTEDDDSIRSKKDAWALEQMLNDTDFRSGVFYQPHSWYSSLRSEGGFEGQPGDLLVSFPAKLKGTRWKAMYDVLSFLENPPQEWEKPLGSTHYVQDIEDFWNRVRSARRMLRLLQKEEDKLKDDGREAPAELKGAMDQLRFNIMFKPDDVAAMQDAEERSRKLLPPPSVDTSTIQHM